MGEEKKTEEEKINLESKKILIEHITKEIEIVSNNIMTFRMKSAFTVWVGPYLLLGSVIIGTKGAFSIEATCGMKGALIMAGVAYLILGYIAGFIERGAWRRCNELRRGLIKLAPDNLSIGEILPDSQIEKLVLPLYLLVFFIIGLSFAAVSYVAIDIKPPSNPASQAVKHNTGSNPALQPTAKSAAAEH